jgi:hypothetical protein
MYAGTDNIVSCLRSETKHFAVTSRCHIVNSEPDTCHWSCLIPLPHPGCSPKNSMHFPSETYFFVLLHILLALHVRDIVTVARVRFPRWKLAIAYPHPNEGYMRVQCQKYQRNLQYRGQQSIYRTSDTLPDLKARSVARDRKRFQSRNTSKANYRSKLFGNNKHYTNRPRTSGTMLSSRIILCRSSNTCECARPSKCAISESKHAAAYLIRINRSRAYPRTQAQLRSFAHSMAGASLARFLFIHLF